MPTDLGTCKESYMNLLLHLLFFTGLCLLLSNIPSPLDQRFTSAAQCSIPRPLFQHSRSDESSGRYRIALNLVPAV